jgi:hypothetical protein
VRAGHKKPSPFPSFFFVIVAPTLLAVTLALSPLLSGDDGLHCFPLFQNMPKQIKEVKDFILTARRKDAKSTLFAL